MNSIDKQVDLTVFWTPAAQNGARNASHRFFWVIGEGYGWLVPSYGRDIEAPQTQTRFCVRKRFPIDFLHENNGEITRIENVSLSALMVF